MTRQSMLQSGVARRWLSRTCLSLASLGLVLLMRLPLAVMQACSAWLDWLSRRSALPAAALEVGSSTYQQIAGPVEQWGFAYPWLWPLLGALGLLIRVTAPGAILPTLSRTKWLLWLSLLLLALGIGAWIRFAPLWPAREAVTWTLDYDEGVYVSAARMWLQGEAPYHDMWLSHPPTGIALLAPAAALGDNGQEVLAAARRTTALLDLLTALMLLWVGIELGGWPIGVVAAAIYLLDGTAGRNSTHVWLETGINLWSVAALGCALRGARRNVLSWLLAAGALAMLAATTKYVGAAILVAMLLGFCVLRRWRMAAALLGGSLLVLGLGLLIALPFGWDNLIRQTVLAQLLRAPHAISAAERIGLMLTTPASVLTFLLGAIGVVAVVLWRSLPTLGWTIVLIWLALVLAALVSSPVFYLHYMTQLVAPLALCGGAVAALASSARWRNVAISVGLIALLVPFFVLQQSRLPQDEHSTAMVTDAERIAARSAADQPLLSFEPLYNLLSDRAFMRAPDGRLLIDSYMHVPGMSINWSASALRDLWGVFVRKQPLAPISGPDPITMMLNQAPVAVFDPSRAPRTVEQAVILANQYRQYPLSEGLLYERTPTKREVTVESLKIRGVVAPMEVSAGESLPVTLLWQMTRPEPRTPYMSLQLVDEQTRKWGQFDKEVGPEGAPFWAWKAGPKIYEDIVPVPIDPATPPGTYRLLLVVYDPATGQPWAFSDEAGQPLGQSHTLEYVTVRPR